MERIYTLDEASDPAKLPERDNPNSVKDIVFNTALNDSRDYQTSVETIVKRQKTACHHLHHKFKNARFHIVATAPITQKQKNLNSQLEEYATSAGISFVSNDAILNEVTGDFKEGTMNGIHYTPYGTKLIAGQLKRSLYANEPLQAANQRPQQMWERQPLLRPSYLSNQNPLPFRQNGQQQSSLRPSMSHPREDNLIDAMSALLQKWKNAPKPTQ